MSKKHTYVLGLNAYDHDVSACLLRDGEIAFAIAKERITRRKHATGFYKEVVDYCLEAEGITLDDVDLVVRNCYVLPVEEMEERLVYQDVPDFLPGVERDDAAKHPLYLSHSDKVVTISHHLAHAYSAFAAVAVRGGRRDGGGRRRQLLRRRDGSVPASDTATPLAREVGELLQVQRHRARSLKKVWLEPDRGFLSDEFYNMPGLGALYSRVSTYIFGDWNKCGEVMGLAPYGRRDQIKPLLELEATASWTCRDWTRRFQAAFGARWRAELGSEPLDAALGGSGLAHPGRHRERAARARQLAARNDRREEPLHGRRRGAELRGQRADRARGRFRQRLDSAGGRRRRHRDRLRLLRLARNPEEARALRDGSRLSRRALQGRGGARRAADSSLVRIQTTPSGATNICRDTAKLLSEEGVRLVSGPLRIRAARARQPQHARGSAQGRDEGHPQQAGQVPAGVPAVRADRAGRAREGDFRRRRGIALHAARQARASGMARQDPGDRACRRHRARADRPREAQSDALSAAQGIRGADRAFRC